MIKRGRGEAPTKLDSTGGGGGGAPTKLDSAQEEKQNPVSKQSGDG